MNPDKTSVIALFSMPRQYVIPVFQRGYVWSLEKQVAPLWRDLEDRALCWLERQAILESSPGAQLAALRKHFLGSVVLAPISNAFRRVPAYEVIDGQQRTTTLHLLILAFRHAAEQLPDQVMVNTLDVLIRNAGEFNDVNDAHKVWPTKAGRGEISFLDHARGFVAVCEEFPVRKDKLRIERPLMIQAYLYLYQSILAFLAGVSMDDPQNDETDHTISDGLIHAVRNDNEPLLPVKDMPPFSPARAQALYMSLQDAVQIMTLTLEGEDDPQVIFETLNARGEPLLASDLIRNFVFLDAARRGQEVAPLYEAYWKGFDEQRDANDKVTANKYWREKERSGRITYPRVDLFFYHYTIFRCRKETKVAHVFQSFKEWWQAGNKDLQLELQRIVTSSNYFKELITPVGTGYQAEFARLVKVLDVSTLTPVYLFLREHYKPHDAALKQALDDLASYLCRRAVCGLTTKSYNRTFLRMLEIMSEPNAGDPAATIRAHLLGLNGPSQRWPSDEDFEKSWMGRAVYKELRSAKTAAILRALEVASRTNRQESVAVATVEELSVEHVLPQGWEKTDHYPLSKEPVVTPMERDALLQTFGNLTLLTQSLNSSVSNGPFLDQENGEESIPGKRTQICGQSILTMNAYFQSQPSWSDESIRTRAKVLFDQAKALWPKP